MLYNRVWFPCQMIIAKSIIFISCNKSCELTAFIYHVINVMIILKHLLQLRCMFCLTLSVHGGDVCDTLLVGISFTMLWFFCVWHAFLRGCVVVGWLLYVNIQNPGYMKENFFIMIESLHLADTGMQQNVSHRLCCWQSSPGFLHVHLCAIFCVIYVL